jgi:DNA-binding beta-propeller fold protein YncE
MQNKQTKTRLTNRLRLATASLLFVAAAALAATAAMRVHLPWAAPISQVGTVPFGVVVDTGTNTIYVTNSLDNTVSVIDGSQCDALDASHCSPVATMTDVGFGPSWPALDLSTHTLYVTNSLTESGEDGNTVAVLDIATCNAHDMSGCSQGAVALVTVGSQAFALSNIALNPLLHTLYVGDANDGPLSIIDTATCNAQQTSGCNQAPMSGATGALIATDPVNDSVYVVGATSFSFTVFNGATCNAETQSDCSTASVAQLPANILAWAAPAIDPGTHTLYLPAVLDPGILGDHLGYAAVIDGSTCNGIDHSGCSQTPPLVQTGSFPNSTFIDPTTKTVYFVNSLSATLSVIDAATCNGQNLAGCPKRVPALATGFTSIECAINPDTHTIYSPILDTNTVWVLDASQCNAQHPEGCTKFARTTPVGGTPVGVKENPDTHSLYVVNNGENTVSIIDTAQCNQRHPGGCNQKWPAFKVKWLPRFFGINRATNTIYLSLFGTDTLAVINGATCNSSTTAGCLSSASTAVGSGPQQIAVDEATNTIYVVNQTDGTMSVVDGSHCNANDSSGCAQSWPVANVGAGPQGLTFNPSGNTVYITNTDDNTVSVIDTTHCNAMDGSGCVPVATFPVGPGPRAAGVVLDTHTLFVANRDDLTVSVIDAATCNGSDTSGCPQVAPPAIVVGAFPETGGGYDILGRSVTVDQQKQLVFLPVPADADVVWLDGNTCTASDLSGCRPNVVPRRMGGFALCSELSDASSTIYVTNNADATVSIFPEPK